MPARGKPWTVLAIAALALSGPALDTAVAENGDGGTPVGAPEPVGCTPAGATTVTHGPRNRDVVALTFDDGPSLTGTPAVLSILNRLHARATFFEEGHHVAQREAVMREILSSGDEIGNHSFNHPLYPGYGQLRRTNRLIQMATGFRPCLFRPPYGLIDSRVESAARRNRLGMVLWDVDSKDERQPGSAAIRANVLSLAQPGSIVLMHDGAHHPQTVTALPGIIRGLRARGLGFATVTQMLGGRILQRS